MQGIDIAGAADLRAVKTPDKQIHYVFAEKLPEFKRSHQVIEDLPAWEGGRRGVLTAKRARDEGFSKLTADNPAEVANIEAYLKTARTESKVWPLKEPAKGK